MKFIHRKLWLLGLALFPTLSFSTTLTGLDVKTPKSLKRDQLVVKDFVGALKIENASNGPITVNAQGSEEYLKNLVIEEKGQALVIKHKDNDSPSLKGIKDLESAGVTLQIPSKVPLQLGLAIASTVIADRTGNIQLEMNGSASASIKSLEGSLKAQINGSGAITVGSLKGNLDTEIQGTGSVKVRFGKSPELKVSIAGTGVVMHDGEVGNADLEIRGPGSIMINHLTGKINQEILGPGVVQIKSKG